MMLDLPPVATHRLQAELDRANRIVAAFAKLDRSMPALLGSRPSPAGSRQERRKRRKAERNARKRGR